MGSGLLLQAHLLHHASVDAVKDAGHAAEQGGPQCACSTQQAQRAHADDAGRQVSAVSGTRASSLPARTSLPAANRPQLDGQACPALPPPSSLPPTNVIHEPLDVAPPVADGGANVEVQLLGAPAVQMRYRCSTEAVRQQGRRAGASSSVSSMGWQQGESSEGQQASGRRRLEKLVFCGCC